MPVAAAADAWRWQPHPEVWFLVLGVVGLSLYATRVIGPKVVPAGQPVLTRSQKVCLVARDPALWLASDWPVHDIGEEYLFSLHMTQHLLLSYVDADALPAGHARVAGPPGRARRARRPTAGCAASPGRWWPACSSTPSWCSPTGRRW